MGANLVADWASGRHAIAYNTLSNSSVVALNLFPDSYFTRDEDAQHLVANAIAFSSTGGEVPIPEPSALILLGCGLVGIGVFRRMSKKS